MLSSKHSFSFKASGRCAPRHQAPKARSNLFKVGLVSVFTVLVPFIAAAQTITASFTVDNSYAIWIGDENGVTGNIPTLNGSSISNPILQDTNTTPSAIVNGETVTFDYVPRCHIYLVAWSDNSTLQGAIGTFSGDISLSTGHPSIQVFGTGIDKQNNQFPTDAEITSAIQTANAGQLWRSAFIGPLHTDTSATNPMRIIPPNIPGLAPDARWIWNNSGNDTANTPWPNGEAPFRAFGGSGHHDEFLVFRIPCDDLVENPVPCETDGQTYKYSIKMICGMHKRDEEELVGRYSLLPGHYSTVVNIRNASACEGGIEKSFNLAIPEGFQKPGGMIEIDGHEIEPELAFVVDCRDLFERSEKLRDIVDSGSFFDGFLELKSDRPLALSSVYTSLDEEMQFSPNIDVENAIIQLSD